MLSIRFQSLLLLLGLSVTFTSADAGLFGPNNFPDCVLEKMKGQDRSLLGTARSACRRQFPEETPLVQGVDYRVGQIVSSWCDTEDDSVVICLDKNESSYKITKAVLTLNDASCGETFGNNVQVDALPATFGKKYKAHIENARTYKCMYTTWYGIKNN